METVYPNVEVGLENEFFNSTQCVKDWSPDDQPREKLLSKGVEALSNAELLAILLRSGSCSENVLQLAQRILASVDNDLNRLNRMSAQQLAYNFKGVGVTKAASIVAALALDKRRRAQEVILQGKVVTSTDTYKYFMPVLRDLDHEEFWVLFLTNTNKIIDRLKIGQGSVDSTIVNTLSIYKEAVTRESNRVIVCHNHPSEIPYPSCDDDDITQKIHGGLNSVNVKLVDHVIIAGSTFYSYRDEGRFVV
ncbi:DNA repair protein RadC [Candidatus Symbiothrix dinenymphae]|nr:DNA repair protein RadC [Candidatus Symbiothrix dinenymphae]